MANFPEKNQTESQITGFTNEEKRGFRVNK